MSWQISGVPIKMWSSIVSMGDKFERNLEIGFNSVSKRDPSEQFSTSSSSHSKFCNSEKGSGSTSF